MTRTIILALTCLLSGCAAHRVLDPDGLSTIRTYRFTSTAGDPQPVWNPVNYAIVARTKDGFAILQEGRGRQEFFASQENRQTWYPAWVNRDQFVFGPQRNVLTLGDGRVTTASDGLTLVTITDTGVACSVRRQQFAPVGFHPRVGRGGVYAQSGPNMVVIDGDGTVSDAGAGFYPEPQVDGPGICWQETPVYERDRWSPTGQSRGRLFIRWKPGVLTEIPGGCQPRWTRHGGVVCTVLRADPPAEGVWHGVGTDVFFIPGPSAEPRLIAKDARDPAPHPREPLVAVSDAGSGVRVVSLQRSCAIDRLLSVSGSRPAWSHDGTRMLLVEPHGDAPAEIVVSVLREDPKTVEDDDDDD